jgi:hypothetical protein
VPSFQRGRTDRPALNLKWAVLPVAAIATVMAAHWSMAQPAQQEAAPAQQGKANKYAKAEDRDRPPAVPPFELDRTLRTVPVAHDGRSFNQRMVSTALEPRDKQGIWVLDFSFYPLRIVTVDVPGKGRRQIHYMYYKIVNRTGQPRKFVPQFVMVNENQQRFEDEVVPEAIPAIQRRQDPSIPVLGAVDIIGVIPLSTKKNVDDAVFGAACWDRWDPKSDRFSIYVRGLSDGYKEFPSESGGKSVAKYKTLKIDFIRRGDQLNLNEREIELADPPYSWVYW